MPNLALLEGRSTRTPPGEISDPAGGDLSTPAGSGEAVLADAAGTRPIDRASACVHNHVVLIAYSVNGGAFRALRAEGRRIVGTERTQSGMLGELGRFSAALEANAADLAHLDGPRLLLAKIVDEVRGILQQQATLRASKQEASRILKARMVEGQRVASGLRSFLQQYYGTRSEKLAEFGLQPYRGRKARTPKLPQPSEATTTPHSESGIPPQL